MQITPRRFPSCLVRFQDQPLCGICLSNGLFQSGVTLTLLPCILKYLDILFSSYFPIPPWQFSDKTNLDWLLIPIRWFPSWASHASERSAVRYFHPQTGQRQPSHRYNYKSIHYSGKANRVSSKSGIPLLQYHRPLALRLYHSISDQDQICAGWQELGILHPVRTNPLRYRQKSGSVSSSGLISTSASIRE